jgi:ABC-2 type transport system permease protein
LKRFLGLLENETLKVLRRRRLRVVLLVLAGLLTLVVWATARQRANERRDVPDWRVTAERRAVEMERRVNERRVPDAWKRWMRFESGRPRYHLSRNIDPDRMTAPLFARGFAAIGSILLIPLLVSVIASDLVSSEFSEGTIALLLTRPVSRAKVLLSKLAAAFLFTTLTLGAALVLSWAIAGFAFGWSGWGAPVLTGFHVTAAGFDTEHVRAVTLWQETLADFGLAWYSALSIACITLLVSVLFRSAAVAMGTMMATLVAGTILSRVAAGWEGAKWIFVTNLALPELRAGVPPPVPGMTLGFSMAVLAVWAAASCAVAFAVFVRRDVTS